MIRKCCPERNGKRWSDEERVGGHAPKKKNLPL